MHTFVHFWGIFWTFSVNLMNEKRQQQGHESQMFGGRCQVSGHIALKTTRMAQKKQKNSSKRTKKKCHSSSSFWRKKKKKTEIIFMENREWNFRGGLFFHFFCKLHALHHAWAINCFSLFWEKLRFNTTLFCFLRFYFSCVRYQGYFMNHDHFFYNKRIFSRITILKFCLNVLMVQLATQAESQKLV